MAIAVQSLVSDIRILSGLRSNQLFTDQMIAELASDAYASLRDVMIVRFAHWFAAYYPFTLNGGAGGNTLDLTLIPDLQMDQCLDQIQGSQKFTVLALGSLAERNQYGNNFGAGTGGLRYFTNGDTLEVLPASAAAGSYELTYTPQYTVLALPIPITRTITTILNSGSDSVVASSHTWILHNGTFTDANVGQYLYVQNTGVTQNDGFHQVQSITSPDGYLVTDDSQTLEDEGFGGSATFQLLSVDWSVNAFGGFWYLPGAGFTQANVGDSLVTSFATNPGNAGTHTILTVIDANTCTTATTGLVDEEFGPLFTVEIQPAGTTSTLPQPITPWALYIKIHASLAIRTSRKQETETFERQLAQQTARAVNMTKQRSEGVRQAPISRYRRSGNGSYWGG